MAEAYVAPGSVNLRSQLNQKNATVAVLKHGERLSIIDVRRRYVKVRTAKGAEGWLDSLDLLSSDDMQRLQREREQYSKLPVEGTATAYETLNIHLDPSRKSPAFAQIPEGGPVQILAHKVSQKVTVAPRPTFALERPRPVSRKQRRSQPKVNAKGPPMPPAPKPPANWEQISGAQYGDESGTTTTSKDAGVKTTSGKPDAKKTTVLEDWTLVRTKANQLGWVLSRNLMMSIPDEVAQYAEGKHITSFFELGGINDEEKGLKYDWLWTTRAAAQPFDFDSWRVFLWNRRRHRYETSYRQRDLEGYFPIHVDAAEGSSTGRSFELITKDDDGNFRRRTYRFDGMRVHLTGTADYNFGQTTISDATQGVNIRDLQSKGAQASWWKRNLLSLKRRFSTH